MSSSLKVKNKKRKKAATEVINNAAVKAAWKKITPAMCHAISARVRRNMLNVIELKGGNFYEEK